MNSWRGGRGRIGAGQPLAPQALAGRYWEDQEPYSQLLEEVLSLVGEPPIPWLFVASPASAGWQQPALELHGPLAGNRLRRLSPRLPGVRIARETQLRIPPTGQEGLGSYLS